jgi:hypothetical protein
MVTLPKIIGVVSCSAVLCLGLSYAAQARMDPGPCPDRISGQPNLLLLKCNEETLRGIKTIKGEVLRVDGNDFLVQRFDGKDVRLHVDANTQMTEIIGRGDRIEAKVREVNDQKQVLSLRHLN